MLSLRGSSNEPVAGLAQPGPLGVWNAGGTVGVLFGPCAPSKITPWNLIPPFIHPADMRQVSASKTMPSAQSSESLNIVPRAVESPVCEPGPLSNALVFQVTNEAERQGP